MCRPVLPWRHHCHHYRYLILQWLPWARRQQDQPQGEKVEPFFLSRAMYQEGLRPVVPFRLYLFNFVVRVSSLVFESQIESTAT
jgi:hypothetical protein